MNGKRFSGWRGCFREWMSCALLGMAGIAGSAVAQSVPSPSGGASPPSRTTTGSAAGTAATPSVPGPTKATPPFSQTTAPIDPGVVQASCSTCGGGLLGSYCGSGGGNCPPCLGSPAPCYPGRRPCDCCEVPKHCLGRLCHGIYECICCPDPCYEPRWNAMADAAFFTNGPRPITQMKFRYDHVWDYPFPDKAELLWRKDTKNVLRSASYRDFYLINETAIDRFGMSIAIPYRQMSVQQRLLPAVPPTNDSSFFNGASGLGDLIIGTKSLLIDCELMQFTFAFNTFLPTGDFTEAKHLGTGHVSLEPALLLALKITPDIYLQSEVAYRFPIGGSDDYKGPCFHYHLSLNTLLCHCGCDLKLIGTAELAGWQIYGGSYTTTGDGNVGSPPLTLSAKTIGGIVSIGPGLRFVICDKVDIGAAALFALTTDSMGDQYLRVELRWRF